MNRSTLKTIIFYLVTAFVLGLVAINLFQIINKSYVYHENKLIKLDSIKLLSRAYILTSAKPSGTSGYEFQSSNGATFHIDGAEYRALNDPNFLYDTLQYSATILTIYTTARGKLDYEKGYSFKKIPVLQLKIGATKYIDFEKANKNRKSIKWTAILIFLGGYLLVIVILFVFPKYQKRQ